MRKNAKIVIVDYGVGNLRSLIRAFEHFGANAEITEDATTIAESNAIVLPGDGAFSAGMEGLKVRGLTIAVKEYAKKGKPILGICLGAQILLSEGHEFGYRKGLDLIPGRVIKFPKNLDEKIPQIGWNELHIATGKSWHNSILEEVRPSSDVYFIHSYIMIPKRSSYIVAISKYGNCKFASVVALKNIWGCQFHPEKSGKVGLAIINSFIKIT